MRAQLKAAKASRDAEINEKELLQSLLREVEAEREQLRKELVYEQSQLALEKRRADSLQNKLENGTNINNNKNKK